MRSDVSMATSRIGHASLKVSTPVALLTHAENDQSEGILAASSAASDNTSKACRTESDAPSGKQAHCHRQRAAAARQGRPSESATCSPAPCSTMRCRASQHAGSHLIRQSWSQQAGAMALAWLMCLHICKKIALQPAFEVQAAAQAA